MKMISATPLLKQLIQKKLLSTRLLWLGINDENTVQWLVDLTRMRRNATDFIPSPKILDKLMQFELLSSVEMLGSEISSNYQFKKTPFPFITAVNFELTYNCNLNCLHCLQRNLRTPIRTKWISTEAACQALQDVWFAGLAVSGVNFTGGEVFLPDSNLLELVETARSLNLEVRINTNGWWGNKNKIQVGNTLFSAPGQVIDWLQKHQVALLALSFDNRYDTFPDLWQSVASVIKECERAGQNYQVVCTGVTENQILENLHRLIHEAGAVPRHLIPISMEMIDIGGAACTTATPLQFSNLTGLVHCSPCKMKGFTRPSFLHIDPNGGVRTCLYAPGTDYLGNINRESLLHIANCFSENPVVSSFQLDNFDPFVTKYFKPYTDLYRAVTHPCATSAILARFTQELFEFRKREKMEPSDEHLRLIHTTIANDLNLCN